MANITIVTPVFNGEKTIAETIRSITTQEPYIHQHVIVNALSTDKTIQIVSELATPKTYVISEKDDGLYYGMNKGIQNATGDVIGIINADDRLEANALQRVSNAFDQNDVEFVYSDINVIDEHSKTIGTQKAIEEWVNGKRSLLGRDWRFNIAIPHPALFVKKELYKRLGMFDTTFRLSADHELVARIINSKAKGLYLKDAPLASFRTGGLSTRKMIQCFEEDKLIAERYGVNKIFSTAIFWRKSQWHRKNSPA